MALVHRGKNAYLYRSFRDGNRVRREYLGSGEVARALAHIIETERGRRQEAREAEGRRWRGELLRLESFEKVVQDYCGLVDSAMRWTMENTGYYLHLRSWRPRPMPPER